MPRVFIVLLFLVLFVPHALAGIGEPLITYDMAYQGPETVCLLVVPDGSGPPLTEARLPDGSQVDATITAEILDLAAIPIANYPAEDMWLVSADGGLVACAGGIIADGPTDALGIATFSNSLSGGGWSNDLAQLVVNGSVVPSRAGLNLVFNSPDLNADLEVNLADVQLFAADFFSGMYSRRSDLNYDLTINLSDIVPLANSMTVVCP